MLTSLIIAESVSVTALSSFFKRETFVLAGSALTYQEGLNLIVSCKPDIVYIDVSVVREHYEELQLIKDQHCFIVLCNGVREFDVLKGFGTGCLLKPFTFESFRNSVGLLSKFLFGSPDSDQSLEIERDYFALKVEGRGLKPVKFYFKDVLYIKAEKKYIRLFCIDGRSYSSKNTLSDLENALPLKLFIRTHKSYIVNISAMVMIKRDLIALSYGQQLIPIGRTYLDNIRKHINAGLLKDSKRKKNGNSTCTLFLGVLFFVQELPSVVEFFV